MAPQQTPQRLTVESVALRRDAIAQVLAQPLGTWYSRYGVAVYGLPAAAGTVVTVAPSAAVAGPHQLGSLDNLVRVLPSRIQLRAA